MSERMQKMVEDSRADLSNLRAKMKLLQKHQVFEAEILAHSRIISSVLQVRAGEEDDSGGEDHCTETSPCSVPLDRQGAGLPSPPEVQGGPEERRFPGPPLGGAEEGHGHQRESSGGQQGLS